MKRLFTICAAIFMMANGYAQAPSKMSYQAVIRNSANTLVTNQAIRMRISILQTTATGTAVYVETQTPMTNANGLASMEIGGGTVVSGNFSTINWANGPYFVKTETDPTGGTNYTITGTSQLLSVPYAMHARNTDTWQLNANASVASTLKRLFVGAEAPAGYGGASIPFKIVGADASNASGIARMGIYRVDTVTGGAAIELRKAYGTTVQNPSATRINNVLGSLVFAGHDGTVFTGNGGALIDGLAMENYTPTTLGTRLRFFTTAKGDITRVNRFSITESGSVVYHPLNAAPATPVKGEMYFDNTINKLRVWDGTTWQNCW
jgi:hypothetical protein